MPPEHAPVTVAGNNPCGLGHRFVLAHADKKILADLGPKGTEEIKLTVGEQVTVTGEQKPSELKVHSIAVRKSTISRYIIPKKGRSTGWATKGMRRQLWPR